MKSLIKHLIISIVGCMVWSCSPSSRYRHEEGAVWNTIWHITYRSDRDLRDSVATVMKKVENSLSPFADSSLIARVNNGDSVVADDLLRRIFEASSEVAVNSGGRFDPTVAPLVNLWGYGYKKTGVEPTPETVDSLLRLVGILECHIYPDGRIEKKHPGTEFNFSAITKGYGCDLIGDMFERNGCVDYMIEIGGEIALSGSNPKGSGWRIMIDAPIDCDTAIVHEQMAVLELTDCGVATSGNYRNYKETAEGRTWHTISPLTGRPALTDVLSATVVAPTAMLADAYATACMAMNAAEAVAMLDTVKGVEALLATRDTIMVTPGFPSLK